MDEDADAYLLETSTVCTKCNDWLRQEKNLCKKCRLVFWPKCSSQLIVLRSSPEGGDGTPQCVCDDCYELVKDFHEYCNTEAFAWNKTTSKGQSWFELSGAQKMKENVIETFQAYLDLYEEMKTDYEQIHKDVDTGRSDPNTFIWEIHEVILALDTTDYKQTIMDVISGFCARNSSIGYCQGMNYITVWLLLFMTKEQAFWTLWNLIENILVPGFYSGQANSLNGFYIESTVINALVEKFVPGFKEAMHAESFTDLFAVQPLIQLFINVVDLQSCIYLWDMIALQGSVGLIRGVVSLIYINKDAIVNDDHPYTILKDIAKRRLESELVGAYAQLSADVTEARVLRLRGNARDYRANQWRQANTMQLRKLEKFSNFSQEEIQGILVEFKKLQDRKRAAKTNSLSQALPKLDGRNRLVTAHRRTTVNLAPEMMNQLQGTEGDVDIGIAKAEFLEVIGGMRESLKEYGSRLFDLYDEDKSGYLDFRELIAWLSVVVNGSFEEKLRLCFDIYDNDKSGYLNKSEMDTLLNNLLKPYEDDVNIPEIQQKIDVNGDGFISFQEFYATMQADAILQSLFTQSFAPVEAGDVKKAMIQHTESIPVPPPQDMKKEEKISTGVCANCSLL